MKKPFLPAVIFYFFVVAIVFPYVKWFADNPDTFQYLAISSKYISGDWTHVLNGYWSPMISWLLVIPMLLFNNQILGFKILQVLIGLFTLWQWHRLLDRTNIQKSWKIILLFVCIPFLIDYSLLNATPDLLFMGLILMLLNFFIEGDITSDRTRALKIGLTGVLLFFTKSFGFPFFIVMTLVIIYFESKIKNGKQFIWRNVLWLYGIFFLICSIWIVSLSLHYGHFTISEAARFNMSREAAPLPGRSVGLPVLDNGLIEPVPYSASAWESPGEYISKEQITPFSFTSEYLQILKRNLLSIYFFDFRHQMGFFFLIMLFLFLIFNGRDELLRQRWLMICLLSVFVLYIGYTLILIHSRYTWINNLLMLTMTAYFIQTVFYKKIFRTFSVTFLIFIFLLSSKRPVKEILFTSDKDFPANWIFTSLKHPFITMSIFYRPDFRLQRIMNELKSKNLLKGNVASLKNTETERDPYASALMILNNSNCRYFGQLDNTMNVNDQVNELSKMKINYLITWKNTVWGNDVPVYYDEMAGVRIYFIK